MQRLIAFLVKEKHWFLFLVLQAFSLGLFLNDSLYHRGLLLYASTWLTGHLNEWLMTGYSYFNLREENAILLGEKARLEQELLALQRQIDEARAAGIVPHGATALGSDSLTPYVTARVISMTNQSGEVYYIINKGEEDGIRKDMPVVSDRGVVGVTMLTGNNYSVVIPITHPKHKLSCTVRGKGYEGQLGTQGHNHPLIFGGLPLHSTVAPGDTLVTSGYSLIFPEGLMVGVISKRDQSSVQGAASAFGAFRVKLSTDFDRLRHVYVLLIRPMEEAQALVNKISEHDQ